LSIASTASVTVARPFAARASSVAVRIGIVPTRPSATSACDPAHRRLDVQDRKPRLEVDARRPDGEREGGAAECVAQRLRRRKGDRPALGDRARGTADGEIGAHEAAARRPIGSRRPDVEPAKAGVREPDAAVGHEAIGFVTSGERDAAASTERIASIEVVVEVREIDARRAQGDGLRVLGHGGIESERAAAHGHASVARA
jgi:hypothetical protein